MTLLTHQRISPHMVTNFFRPEKKKLQFVPPNRRHLSSILRKNHNCIFAGWELTFHKQLFIVCCDVGEGDELNGQRWWIIRNKWIICNLYDVASPQWLTLITDRCDAAEALQATALVSYFRKVCVRPLQMLHPLLCIPCFAIVLLGVVK